MKNILNVVLFSIFAAHSVAQATPKLQTSAKELAMLFKKNNVSGLECNSLKPIDGKMRTIELLAKKSDVDSSGFTVVSPFFYYGTNEIRDVAVGISQVLVNFGEEGNYTLVIDISSMAEGSYVNAKLIEEEAEDGQYIFMECNLLQ